MKKNKRPNLINLFFGTIVLLIKLRLKTKKAKALSNFKNYILVKEIFKEDKVSSLTLGIYTLKSRKYFVKTWHGRIKDLNYYFLVNEYLSSGFISQKLKQFNNQNISTPQIVDIYETENSFSVVFEFIEAKSLTKYDPDFQAKKIDQVIEMLEKISINLTKQEIDSLPKRELYKYLFLLPIVCLLIIIKKPRIYKTILSSLYNEFKEVVHNNNLRLILAHRDLTPSNILIKNNKIYLLDFDSLVLTLPEYDKAYISVMPNLENLNKYLNLNLDTSIFGFLQIYICLHQTIGSGNFLKIQPHFLRMLSLIAKPGKSLVKRKSVTIGIPAHNEESNISNLLKSIISQKGDNFKLDKIIVACDDCKDNTVREVRILSRKKPIIKIIDDGKRYGKAERLNRFYRMNNSDIFIAFDADIKLGHNQVVSQLVSKFQDPEVGLVGGGDTPFSPSNFIEKIIVTGINLWYEARININGGDSVHNHQGCVSAMSRSLCQKAILPEDLIADDEYLYFEAK